MKKHTTYRGQSIDMEMLKFNHQTSVALGNANMNARGDLIGRGGTVIKKREQLMAERELEMQKPDISPEHTSHSTAPQMADPMDFADTGFDDSQFEFSPEPEEAPKKAPVKRAKVLKDDSQSE